jgi:DnaJ like chaperone protein|tara:strand:- start:158 stop:862 length:705 start_codon:yes stop_codon:yes gene_type:complete
MYKWFLGLFGFFIYKIPGFFLGFFIGSFLDNGGIRRVNSNIVKEFEINLLSLASILIKSDGKVSSSELQFVRNYFISIYGSHKAGILFKKFNNEVDKSKISPEKICFFYSSRTTYETRLQIINLLFNIAKSDGNISKFELDKLLEFSNLMKISRVDFESLKAMFIKSNNSNYKILEVDKNCTNSELKKAYRDLAKKHHPDKVQHLGEAYTKSAKEKFSRIQSAYESIKKQRGIA